MAKKKLFQPKPQPHIAGQVEQEQVSNEVAQGMIDSGEAEIPQESIVQHSEVEQAVKKDEPKIEEKIDSSKNEMQAHPKFAKFKKGEK